MREFVTDSYSFHPWSLACADVFYGTPLTCDLQSRRISLDRLGKLVVVSVFVLSETGEHDREKKLDLYRLFGFITTKSTRDRFYLVSADTQEEKRVERRNYFSVTSSSRKSSVR